MTIGRAEANDEQVGIVYVALHLEVWHLDIGNLLLAQARHQVVVLRIRRDGSRLRVFLQSAEDMSEALASRHSPVTGTILCTHIGCPLAFQFLRHVRWIDRVKLGEIRELEGSRAVGHEGIGKQHHRSHVLQGHLTGLIGGIETVCRTGGGHHGHRALAVTSEEHL